MEQTLQLRGVTITLRRPELSPEQREKREKDVIDALSAFARGIHRKEQK